MSGSAAGQQLAGLRQLRGRWRSIHVPVFRRTDGRLDGTSTRVTATKRCDEADAGQVFDRTCGTESRVGLFGRVSFFSPSETDGLQVARGAFTGTHDQSNLDARPCFGTKSIMCRFASSAWAGARIVRSLLCHVGPSNPILFFFCETL